MTGPNTQPSKRQIRTNRFMRAAVIGAAAWVISYVMQFSLSFGEATPALRWLNYGVFLVFFGALVVQFYNRKADEFTSGLWYSAASVSFVLTTAWMLFAVQIEYWINYMMYQSSGQSSPTGYAYFVSFLVPPAAFYATFFFRLWKDR